MRDHIFSLLSSLCVEIPSQLGESFRMYRFVDIHLLSVALGNFVHPVCHDYAHRRQVVYWSKAANGEVALVQCLLVLRDIGESRLCNHVPCIELAHSHQRGVDLEACRAFRLQTLTLSIDGCGRLVDVDGLSWKLVLACKVCFNGLNTYRWRLQPVLHISGRGKSSAASCVGRRAPQETYTNASQNNFVCQ